MDDDIAIHTYFSLGYSHAEILECLASQNIVMSMRTLRRRLKNLNLYRRKNKSDILEVALFIFSELQEYGQLHGYTLTHLKCMQHGFVLTQDTELYFTFLANSLKTSQVQVDPMAYDLRLGLINCD